MRTTFRGMFLTTAAVAALGLAAVPALAQPGSITVEGLNSATPAADIDQLARQHAEAAMQKAGWAFDTGSHEARLDRVYTTEFTRVKRQYSEQFTRLAMSRPASKTEQLAAR